MWPCEFVVTNVGENCFFFWGNIDSISLLKKLGHF
jgi:hypothetical protein